MNLNSLHSQPVYHPISQLVYACGREQVSHVWVAGRQVISEGQLTTLDQSELLHRALIGATGSLSGDTITHFPTSLFSKNMSYERINVDHAEVSKFEELASRWWDPHSEFKPLHEINPLRLDYIDKLAPLAGKRVLDVGCGGGILSESMAARGAMSPASTWARRRCRWPGCICWNRASR